VGDDAPQLSRIAFDFDEGAAKLMGFSALRKRLLQETAEPVLRALNPQKVLDLLECTCAGNSSCQKQTAQDLSTAETGRVLEGLKMGEMIITDPHTDEMPKIPHAKIIGSIRRLSS